MKRDARKTGRSETLGLLACGLLLCLILPAPPSWSQDLSIKELLGRAQSEAEKKAVEDLIRRLQPAPKTTTTPAPSGAGGGSSTQPAKDEEPAKRQMGTEADPRAPPKGPTDGEQKPREAAVESAGGPAASVGDKPAGGPGDKTATAERSASTETGPEQMPKTEVTPELSPEKVVEQAERSQLPSVDLEVQFEYNSATLTQQAVETLTPLGHALSDARLADGAFLIAGHTDAKGTSSYNLRLSQRRAEAVSQFLIENFKIAPERLVAKGLGKSHLKAPQSPRAAENRRVQIVNFKQRGP